MIDLTEAQDHAIKLAKQVGQMLLENRKNARILEKSKEIHDKKDKGDVLTDIDIKSEDMIIKGIESLYPTHNIFSEECKTISKNSDYTWVIDPIDGTKCYLKSIPMFTVSIALQYKEELVVGVVYEPSSDSMYKGAKGMGAFLNNEKLDASKTSDLNRSVIYLDNFNINELDEKERLVQLDILNRIIKGVHRIRAFGVGSLAFCYVAAGLYDAYYDVNGITKLWDIGAGAVIAQEAGAVFVNTDGSSVLQKNSHYLLANPSIYAKFRDLLNK